MIPTGRWRRLALLPAALACFSSPPALAGTDVEHRAEITAEASWYPRGAAHAGQEDSFLHVEAKPELVVYGDRAEAILQPRISGGTGGDGMVDFREANVTTRIGDADLLVGSTILFWGKVEGYNPVDIVTVSYTHLRAHET